MPRASQAGDRDTLLNVSAPAANGIPAGGGGGGERECYDEHRMAKIRPASGRRATKGPKNPQAISCIVLLALLFGLLGIVLYLSIARG